MGKTATTHQGNNKICFESARIIYESLKKYDYATTYDLKNSTGITAYFVNNLVLYLQAAGCIKRADLVDKREDRKRQFSYQIANTNIDTSNEGKVLFSVRAGLSGFAEILKFTEMSTPCLVVTLKALIDAGELTTFEGDYGEHYAVIPLLCKFIKTPVPTDLISSTTYSDGKKKDTVVFDKQKKLKL